MRQSTTCTPAPPSGIVTALLLPGSGAGRPGGRQLACRRGHGFDIARHGYVNLTAGRSLPSPFTVTVDLQIGVLFSR